jgi:hypothetical protein
MNIFVRRGTVYREEEKRKNHMRWSAVWLTCPPVVFGTPPVAVIYIVHCFSTACQKQGLFRRKNHPPCDIAWRVITIIGVGSLTVRLCLEMSSQPKSRLLASAVEK